MTAPITAKDISVKQIADDPCLQVRACLHLTCQIDVDRAELRRYPDHRERILEDAEGRARSFIAERLYGKVRRDAQTAYETLRSLLEKFAPFDPELAKSLNHVFDPLLHAGSELVILKKELEPA